MTAINPPQGNGQLSGRVDYLSLTTTQKQTSYNRTRTRNRNRYLYRYVFMLIRRGRLTSSWHIYAGCLHLSTNLASYFYFAFFYLMLPGT